MAESCTARERRERGTFGSLTRMQLTTEYSERPSFSPDGKSVLSRYGDPAPKIALTPSDAGPPRLLDLPEVAQSNFFQWALDGRGVVYVISRDRVYNLWSQSLDGGPRSEERRVGEECGSGLLVE